MRQTNMIASESESLWSATADVGPEYAPLAGDADIDVAIVGAGYTGLSTGLHLAEQGISAIVLDDHEPGWGASGRNGGQVIAGLKEDPDEIEQAFGAAAGGRLVATVSAAPQAVFDLIARHDIACDANSRGWLQPATNAARLIETHQRAAQWRARGVAAESLSAREMSDRLGTDTYIGGFYDPRGGTVHPLKYARGLARAAMDAGARICANTPVQAIEPEQDGYRLICRGGAIRSRRIVLATNGYSGPLHDGVRRSVVPVISTIIATQPLSDAIRATILPGGSAASDTKRLLNYFRLSPDGRLLMGGRGRESTRAERHSIGRLQSQARRLFPQIGDISWAYAWRGRVAVTPDHYPRLHELAPGLFCGFGFHGRGVAIATIMGRELANLAAGRPAEDMQALLTPLRPIRLHRMNRLAVSAYSGWSRLCDKLGV